MTIPYTAMEVNAQRERYRILRVNVMTVVRMYNKVRPPSVSAVSIAFVHTCTASSALNCSS